MNFDSNETSLVESERPYKVNSSTKVSISKKTKKQIDYSIVPAQKCRKKDQIVKWDSIFIIG